MAEQDLDRSEEATPFKLEEARKKGTVAKSMDFNAWVMLVVGIFTLLFMLPAAGPKFAEVFSGLWAGSSSVQLTPQNLGPFSLNIVSVFIDLFWPFLLVVAVAAIFSNWFQSGIVLSVAVLKPDFNRLNPVEGLKRFFNKRILVEALKTFVKVAMCGTALYFIFKQGLQSWAGAGDLTPPGLGKTLLTEAKYIAIWLIVLLAITALIDWVYSRWEFAQRMRMSRRDVKDEVKRREGDPRIRQRLREIRREMLKRSQSLGRVQDADVLITNPTHVAIGLRYRNAIDAAPFVVAKGAGQLAALMKLKARRLQIPIIEQPPLARQLLRAAKIDEAIPAEFYVEISKIYAVLLKQKNRHTRAV